MPGIGFNEDIAPIFRPFAACMRNVDVATDEGIFTVDLADYAIVRRLHELILTALRGHDPATPSGHPMPPSGPLPAEKIALFAQWIDDGMPETRLVA